MNILICKSWSSFFFGWGAVSPPQSYLPVKIKKLRSVLKLLQSVCLDRPLALQPGADPDRCQRCECIGQN
jgi:hypothetical protein